MLKKIKFKKFTAFESLEVKLSPGINVFLGENGTGKTHVLKAAYAACDIVKSKGSFAEKITNVFYPSGKKPGRLVKRHRTSSKGSLEVVRELAGGKEAKLRLSLSSHTTKADRATVSGSKVWSEHPMSAAYIPAKDMMANAPGFSALYEAREVHFEEVYADIVHKASLPVQKGPISTQRKDLLESLQQAMDGKVTTREEEFFLRSKYGTFEFTLLAEGYRKLGLLWVLIRNGTLLGNAVLFWDEPEANLNPKLMKAVVDILIKLQRQGVQILLATHNYVTLKEFDLQIEQQDKLTYHSLYRDKGTKEIALSSTSDFLSIQPNAIDDTFGEIISREIEKSMGKLGK